MLQEVGRSFLTQDRSVGLEGHERGAGEGGAQTHGRYRVNGKGKRQGEGGINRLATQQQRRQAVPQAPACKPTPAESREGEKTTGSWRLRRPGVPTVARGCGSRRQREINSGGRLAIFSCNTGTKGGVEPGAPVNG